MKTSLTVAFLDDEVYRALMQMAPLKAPGPDGFSAEFYQQQWKTVGREVCNVALKFFQGSDLDKNINFTHIALIPKKKQPLVASLIFGQLASVKLSTK